MGEAAMAPRKRRRDGNGVLRIGLLPDLEDFEERLRGDDPLKGVVEDRGERVALLMSARAAMWAACTPWRARQSSSCTSTMSGDLVLRLAAGIAPPAVGTVSFGMGWSLFFRYRSDTNSLKTNLRQSFRITVSFMDKSAPTGRQLAAARTLLGLSQGELAEKSAISVATLKRMEGSAGPAIGMPNNVAALRRALEDAGVIFVEENGAGPGVRLKK
jgi:hypothetical protein